MNPQSSNKTVIITTIVVLMLGAVGWYVYGPRLAPDVYPAPATQTEITETESEADSPAENVSEVTELHGKPLTVYTNHDLKFSFKYPAEFDSVTFGFDTYDKRVGEHFGGVISLSKDKIGPAMYFGASSHDYDPILARGIGLDDITQSLDIKTSEYETVSPIRGNGVDGILIEGTEKCVDLCPYADTLQARFPIPENKWGITVMGVAAYKMPKEDFVKLMSTFTVLE